MLSQSAAALAAGARSYAALGVDDHVRPNLCCSRHCRPVPEPLHDVRQGIQASHELGKHQECRLEIGEIQKSGTEEESRMQIGDRRNQRTKGKGTTQATSCFRTVVLFCLSSRVPPCASIPHCII